MVILYFVRWFNIILVLRFLFQPGRLCTKLGFFVYYYLPYCYLHQTQENENVRTIKEGKIILKIALRLWSYVLDFLFSNPIVWSYIFRRIYLFVYSLIVVFYKNDDDGSDVKIKQQRKSDLIYIFIYMTKDNL